MMLFRVEASHKQFVGCSMDRIKLNIILKIVYCNNKIYWQRKRLKIQQNRIMSHKEKTLCITLKDWYGSALHSFSLAISPRE